MAQSQVNTRIVLRNDSLANWEAVSSVILLKGEVGIAFLENGEARLKIGDGVSTWAELNWVGGEAGTNVQLAVDGKSIVVSDNVLALMGFEAAEVGAYPVKGENGSLQWVIPSSGNVSELKETIETLQTQVTEIREIVLPPDEDGAPLLSRVETLEHKMNETGEGTVDARIDAKINAFASAMTDDGKVNTIMEMIQYIESHGEEAANMSTQIVKIEELVGSVPVSEQIMAVVNASGHLAEERASALYEHIKYEISSKPEGTLVNYGEKEIRVMCPADTKWVFQESGANADANSYYIGFKAYAPRGAVSFKEDLAEIISDTTMYYFEDNGFAGTDAHGRKYSIVWLPVARNDDGIWTYHGKNSSKSKYIGWYYSVEWYDANGKLIESDIIRINLSNENCHNTVEPYFMGEVVKTICLNGEEVAKEEGNVNLSVTIDSIIKSSKEIVVNEDGTLGVGFISPSKIATDDNTTLVLNGGGAAD